MTPERNVLETRGPFKVVGRLTAYENRWIRVIEDSVIRPNGDPGIFGVIEVSHGRGGVAVLPVDHDQNVYLVREFTYATNRCDLETVGGGVDDGENALTAAKRELFEEIGVAADEWVDLGRVAHATTIMRAGAQLFLAKGFHARDLTPENGIRIESLTMKDAVALVMAGEIQASTTCCLVLKAARLMRI